MKYTVDTEITHALTVRGTEIENTEKLGELLDLTADEIAALSESEIEDEIGDAVTEWAARFWHTSWSAVDEKGKPVSRS